MKRLLLQIYTQNRAEPFAFYQNAFLATPGYCETDANGNVIHAELNICGQSIAVGALPDGQTENITGNTMQFCLHFEPGEEHIIKHAYDAMKEQGKVLVPLGPCFFSAYMTDLVDPYGVRWRLFV